MLCKFSWCAIALLLATSLSYSAPEGGRTQAASLTAEEIVEKVIANAQERQSDTARDDYLYNKVSVAETLDGRAQVKERKEKVYLIQAGKAHLQQVKVNGKLLSHEELRKEDRATAQARQEVTESKSSQRDENWDRFLTKDILSKYAFTLVGAEDVNDRPAYVLTFSPRHEDLPIRSMVDRVLNRLSGKVWIDEQEFEIAKANISLQSQASLGGVLKVVGALKRLDYSVERIRLAENTWFNRATRGDFETRKLWDSNRVRTRSESQGFQKHQAAQTK